MQALFINSKTLISKDKYNTKLILQIVKQYATFFSTLSDYNFLSPAIRHKWSIRDTFFEVHDFKVYFVINVL